MNAPLTSRRALLQGAVMLTAVPVATTAGAVSLFDVAGAPEPVEPETPIQRLFAQWQAVMAQSGARDLMDEEGAVLDEVRHPIEDAIRDETATSLRDLAIKVIVLSGDGMWALPDEMTLECATLAGRDFAQMPRCLFDREAAAA